MAQVSWQLKQETRQRIGYWGWGIILTLNLMLFLLPGDYTLSGLTQEVWLVIMLGVLLIAWLGMCLGLFLLFIRYFPFFQEVKGTLLFLGLFVLGLRLFSYLQVVDERGWLATQLFVLLAIWLFSLVSTLPFVLSVYLWYQDRAARLVAVTFLITIWLLVGYTRWHGPEQTMLDVWRGVLPAELFGLLCFSQLVLFLAPVFFVGHGLRLLYREWTRADTLTTLEPQSDLIVEEHYERII